MLETADTVIVVCIVSVSVTVVLVQFPVANNAGNVGSHGLCHTIVADNTIFYYSDKSEWTAGLYEYYTIARSAIPGDIGLWQDDTTKFSILFKRNFSKNSQRDK